MRPRLVAGLLILSSACASPDPFPGYVNASADVRTVVVREVLSYYEIRSEASAFRDTSALLRAYPELATGSDRQTHVNMDVFLPERMRASDVGRVTVEVEHYEPVRVLVRGTDAMAFVHGLETWHYERSNPGTGEFLTRIDLRHTADRWTITRTDEFDLGEPRPRTPRP